MFIHWSTSDALYEADKAARQRYEWESPVRAFHNAVSDAIMPETLARVLEAAGLQVSRIESQIKVEGRVADHLKSLI